MIWIVSILIAATLILIYFKYIKSKNNLSISKFEQPSNFRNDKFGNVFADIKIPLTLSTFDGFCMTIYREPPGRFRKYEHKTLLPSQSGQKITVIGEEGSLISIEIYAIDIEGKRSDRRLLTYDNSIDETLTGKAGLNKDII